MRVLMTADAVGGVWTYVVDLAGALARNHRVHVTLATMGPAPSPAQVAEAERVPALELVTSGFRLEWMDDPWRDVEAAGEWLLGLARQMSPDVVHLNGYVHARLPWQQPVVVAGHSCCLSWAEAVGREVRTPTLAAYRAAVAEGLQAADWVVAPSQAMLASLQRWYGPLPRASVVANGRSACAFRPARKEPFVFAAGRLWDAAKNIAAVIAVAPRLPWPVAVAGPTGLEGGAPITLPGAKHLGRLSPQEMAAWLGRAAIFAAPARYEPFGLLPLEAALSGCALVLGDIPSLREVWGDAADFVAPDDHGALEAAISALIASPQRLVARALAAREHAVGFSLDRMAAGYAELYETLVSAPCGVGRVPCAS